MAQTKELLQSQKATYQNAIEALKDVYDNSAGDADISSHVNETISLFQSRIDVLNKNFIEERIREVLLHYFEDFDPRFDLMGDLIDDATVALINEIDIAKKDIDKKG